VGELMWQLRAQLEAAHAERNALKEQLKRNAESTEDIRALDARLRVREAELASKEGRIKDKEEQVRAGGGGR
jgi:hypothetical protein